MSEDEAAKEQAQLKRRNERVERRKVQKREDRLKSDNVQKLSPIEILENAKN